MKKIIISLLILFVAKPIVAQTSLKFTHDKVEREYILYVPKDLPQSPPLVFVLHGYTSSDQQIMQYSGMNKVADTAKFIVCYPMGTIASTQATHWNARLSMSTTDDIGFLSALAIHLQDSLKASPHHTFSCGHSNGGYMSYT